MSAHGKFLNTHKMGLWASAGILIMLVCICVFFSVAAGETAEEPGCGDYIEVEGKTAHDLSTGFIYRDAMMLVNQNCFSTDLVKVAASLAAAGYSETCVNHMLVDMGYNYTNLGFLPRHVDDNDHVAFTVGWKYVPEANKTLWCIVVRGTLNNAEWFSNFNLGKNNGGNHEGFYLAAYEALNQLDELVLQKGTLHNVYLFTGHSRGAAVSNIMAAEYTKRKKTVFGYTFACPAVSKNADTNLQNIYNINNTGDVVTTVPLEEWGYKRNGRTYEFSFSHMPSFTEKFTIAQQHKYAATSDSIAYVEILKAIVPTENDYYETIRHFGMMLLAYVMGGKNDCTWLEFLNEYYDGTFLEKVRTATNPLGLFNLFKSETENAIALVAFVNSALDSTASYDENEFGDFLNQNKLKIDEIYEKTGERITSYYDLGVSLGKLYDFESNTNSIGTIIACVMDICDNSDDVTAAIWDGHDHTAYVLFVNNQYYGYRGKSGTSIVSGSIPKDIHTVGQECFYNCKQLTSFSAEEDLRYIGQAAYAYCSALQSVTIPDTVTGLGPSVFAHCSSLETLVIPDSLERIGDSCFTGLPGLRNLTVPVEYLCQNRIFLGANSPDWNIETLYITKGKTCIMGDLCTDSSDSNTYYYRSVVYMTGASLKSVELENGITNIGDMAFYGDFNPDNFTIKIPESIERIGEKAFQNRKKLADQIYLSENLTELGEYCFAGSDISTVVFPSSLKSLPAYGFCNCQSLTSLTIPETIEEIGDSCFGVMNGLKELTIPADFLAENRLFYEPGTSFHFTAQVETLHITKGKTGIIGNHTDDSSDDNACYSKSLTFKCKDTLSSITLEEGIISIGDYAFYDSSPDPTEQTMEISLPSTIRSIGKAVFGNRKNLPFSMDLPEGLTELGESAFYNTNIVSVTFPSTLTSIGYNCFAYCASLKSAVIPESVTTLGSSAFANCSSLETLVIPDSAEQIGDSCFTGLPGLLNLTVPVEYLCQNRIFLGASNPKWNIATLRITKGKTGIMGDLCTDHSNSNTYYYRSVTYMSGTKLKEVSLEEGILSIGEMAFYAGFSRNDSVIRLPRSLTSIGTSAFKSSRIANALYAGSEDEWLLVQVQSNNDPLLNVLSYASKPVFVNLAVTENANIYESGSESADVLARVPGGSKMDLLETDTDWTKVRTDGGTVGFVDSDIITTGFPYVASAGFVLPDQLIVISEQAFAGISIKCVCIPNHCTTIESKAFDDTELKMVYVPESVQSIASDAFPEGTYLFTPENSYTANWVKDKGHFVRWTVIEQTDN